MEQVIEEKLEEIYNLNIDVEFVDFRRYIIFIYLKYGEVIHIPFEFNCKVTIDSNIQALSIEIDREIVKLYKKVG